VLISNTGGIAANLTGFRFLRGDAGFFLPTVPVLPQAVAPEQTRALEVAFAAPAGNTATQLVDALTLTFDDPALPEATIALSATVTPNLPPVACAVVVSAQELDGTIQHATSGTVAIEPGARAGLSAFGEEAGDAGDPACSYDPEAGRNGLGFSWSVAAAPAGSTAAFSTPTDPRPTFVPDLPGDYRLQLRVQDAQGASATADLSFTAAPLEDLTVKLSWPGQPQIDLDLHLVRPGGAPFQATDDVSSLTADAGHDWGTPADPTDNPHFSGDDVGDGQLAESVWLDRPQDGCLGDGGCAYGVWVHEFQDRRAPTGAGCGQTACFEGTACGCTGAGEVCEPGPNGASCATGAAPRLEVFLKGQVAPALSIPIAPATVMLPGPCFTWHALEIAVRPDGGVGAMAQPGDGGDVQYWGSHADTQRECEAGAGGYAPTSPPLLP
jgi:hypothetical protein